MKAFKLISAHTYTVEELKLFLAEAKILKIRNPTTEQKYENRIQQIKSELRKKCEPIK